MKNTRDWSDSEIRSLAKGEFTHYASTGQHYYTDKEWYVWFLGNATRYSIFQTSLWKYGSEEMVSYTDLTQTEKIGAQRLKIDSIKATIREGLSLGYIEAFKSESDKRVTMYSFNQSILQEVGDYCFMMRRNRMLELADFIGLHSTENINKELTQASMKQEWFVRINEFIALFATSVRAIFGKNQLPIVTSTQDRVNKR